MTPRGGTATAVGHAESDFHELDATGLRVSLSFRRELVVVVEVVAIFGGSRRRNDGKGIWNGNDNQFQGGQEVLREKEKDQFKELPNVAYSRRKTIRLPTLFFLPNKVFVVASWAIKEKNKTANHRFEKQRENKVNDDGDRIQGMNSEEYFLLRNEKKQSHSGNGG
jgi:hypothetical protein